MPLFPEAKEELSFTEILGKELHIKEVKRKISHFTFLELVSYQFLLMELGGLP